MQNRDILIMDEPTSGLDYENMLRVANLIAKLREQGKLIIIVSHDFELILQTCTRILHMENGMICRDYVLDHTNLHLLRDFFVSEKEEL